MSRRNDFGSIMARVSVCEHGFSCNKCCWLWEGRLNKDGYPQVQFNGQTITVNRIILQHITGVTLTPDRYALHTCDVRFCCSWHHIYEGDYHQNMKDMADRNRRSQGHSHKLYKSQVYQIRRLYCSGSWTVGDLCKIFPVKKSTMQRIIKHEDYPNLKGECLYRRVRTVTVVE